MIREASLTGKVMRGEAPSLCAPARPQAPGQMGPWDQQTPCLVRLLHVRKICLGWFVFAAKCSISAREGGRISFSGQPSSSAFLALFSGTVPLKSPNRSQRGPMGWHADGRVGTVIPGVGVGRNLFTDPRLSSAGALPPPGPSSSCQGGGWDGEAGSDWGRAEVRKLLGTGSPGTCNSCTPPS